jgi:hypothetical protein
VLTAKPLDTHGLRGRLSSRLSMVSRQEWATHLGVRGSIQHTCFAVNARSEDVFEVEGHGIIVGGIYRYFLKVLLSITNFNQNTI